MSSNRFERQDVPPRRLFFLDSMYATHAESRLNCQGRIPAARRSNPNHVRPPRRIRCRRPSEKAGGGNLCRHGTIFPPI